MTGPGNRLLSDGTWTYTYDDAGELVKKSKGADAETWAYGYDFRGQLAWAEQRATDGGQGWLRVDYAYDALGNLLWKVVHDYRHGDLWAERYVADGWDTAKPAAVGSENVDVWADLDEAAAVKARRLFGPLTPPVADRTSCYTGDR